MSRVGRVSRLTADTGLDGYALARVVVAVRVAVVMSIAVLVAAGPGWMRAHAAGTAAVLVGGLLYAAVLIAMPRYEVRQTRFAWSVSVLDAAFTLALVGLTGGAASPVASVFALVVIGRRPGCRCGNACCCPDWWGAAIWRWWWAPTRPTRRWRRGCWGCGGRCTWCSPRS